MKNGKSLLEQAKAIAASAESWADLSNALFDPATGLITRAYPTPADRAWFQETEEYQQIRQLVTEAMERHGLVEGAVPTKGSRSRVPLPER
jgi:hypothetical protein